MQNSSLSEFIDEFCFIDMVKSGRYTYRDTNRNYSSYMAICYSKPNNLSKNKIKKYSLY